MRVRGRGTIGFVAGAVAATTLTATTMAIAGDSRSSSTLHACAARHGGALRLATSCTASERRVTWSVKGPRGPKGRRGKAGADGAGPAYLSRQSGSTLVGSGPLTNVDSFQLPPGAYLVTATATASSPAANDNGSCQLSGAGLSGESASFSLTSAHGEALSVTGLAQATTVDDTVKLLCGGQTSVSIAEGLLTAVQVRSVSDLSP